jgi:hypothetical protein
MIPGAQYQPRTAICGDLEEAPGYSRSRSARSRAAGGEERHRDHVESRAPAVVASEAYVVIEDRFAPFALDLGAPNHRVSAGRDR